MHRFSIINLHASFFALIELPLHRFFLDQPACIINAYSQDIAVVPLLVLLPLIESSTGLDTASGLDLLQAFGPTILTTLGWVGALILGGRTILRRVFEVGACAVSRCIAACCDEWLHCCML